MPADSHCHLNDPAFVGDIEEVIASIEEAEFACLLNVGYDIATSEKAVSLAHRYPYMYASAGIHPHHASTANKEVMNAIGEIGQDPSVVAIGETGLDYFRDRSPRDVQQKVLRAHLAIARRLEKPVIIHCRDAMADCLKILEEEGADKTGGVMHCFGGTKEDVGRIIDLGFYISFAGNITYPKAQELRDALKVTPGHRLLVETDAPYLAPQKKRGKRNSPLYLNYVIEKAAEVRGVTVEDIERIAVNNFGELFLKQTGKGEITYQIRNSLYLNVTQACSNECYFCGRLNYDTVQGHNLRLTKDPTATEMIAAIGDPKTFDEIVFCGYGEPTIHLDRVLEVAKAVKSKGAKTRLNTNGHGSYLAKQDITHKLVGLIDSVSVSLNAADEKTYNEICTPLIPDAWRTTVDFIRSAKKAGLDVTATAVAIPDKVDIDAVRRFAEDDLGVAFRVRAYNLVG